MEDEQMAVSNSDYLTTETTIDPSLPVEAVVEHLRKRRAVGQLVFHLSQGSIQRVALVEKTRVKAEKRGKIRELLGV